MEWLAEDAQRGQRALWFVALTLATAIVLLGHKRLLLAFLGAFAFLILAAMVIPSAIPARFVAQKNACISNLRRIQEGKEQWAKATNKSPSDIPTEKDLYGEKDGEGFIRHRQTCPRGGIYNFGAVCQEPVCSLGYKGHQISKFAKPE